MSSLDEHLPAENYRWKAIAELIEKLYGIWRGFVFFVGIFQID